MKICHIIWGLSVGGIETMLVSIANIQAGLGHHVTVLAFDGQPDPVLVRSLRSDIRFECMEHRRGSKSLLPFLKMNMRLAREHADIVHFHNVNQRRFILPFLRRKSCTTCHSMAVDPVLPYFKGTKNLVAISEGVRNDILRRTGVDSEVIYNGIDVSAYRCRDSWCRADSGQPFRIVQIGRLDCSIKGQDRTLRAVAELQGRGVCFTVDFIGDGADRPVLERMAADLGVADRIRFLGLKPSQYVRQHLADYDLLVQPSVHEGFGLTIAEAMAAKVPVVASDIEAQREVLGGGVLGRLFEPDSSVAFADAIGAVVADGDAVGPTEEKAHSFAVENFDVTATTARYLEKYASVIVEGNK